MNDLTINDIHRIRREHEILTQNMSFDEYKADLRKEIKPLFDLLKSMKFEKNNKTSYFEEIESSVVAEPKTLYQIMNKKT